VNNSVARCFENLWSLAILATNAIYAFVFKSSAAPPPKIDNQASRKRSFFISTLRTHHFYFPTPDKQAVDLL
jgi:hypothetical protein